MSSGAKGGNRVAGQVKDGLGRGCLYSQQAGLGQEGGHLQVRRACVIDNLEFLRGCSDGDTTQVDQLQGEGGSGLVQNWLPSIHTLMPPSRCHISLDINF